MGLRGEIVIKHSRWLLTVAAGFTLWSGALSAQATLGDSDRKAIAAQIETYRRAWLAGDPSRILSLFTEDAVFMPHHGLEPVVGLEALRAFWWPPGAGVTRIARFDLETRAIEGSADLAYAWGRQVLEWTTKDAKGQTRFRTRGNHLTVLRRTADGWKICLQIGDDEPNERF